MEVKPIESDAEYWEVREEVTHLMFTAEPDSPEGRWAEGMMVFVSAYEAMNPELSGGDDWISLAQFFREFIELAESKPDRDPWALLDENPE